MVNPSMKSASKVIIISIVFDDMIDFSIEFCFGCQRKPRALVIVSDAHVLEN